MKEENMYQVPLEMMCRHERTAEVCRAAIEEDGWQLENVPEEMKTPELCRRALDTGADLGNEHLGLLHYIPFPDVCLDVLKECHESGMTDIYEVATAIRAEVMNDAIADYLLPIDGKCLSILPVHLQTPERVKGGGRNVGDVRSGKRRCKGQPENTGNICRMRRP